MDVLRCTRPNVDPVHHQWLKGEHKVISLRRTIAIRQDTKAVSTAPALPPVLGVWSLSPRVWNG